MERLSSLIHFIQLLCFNLVSGEFGTVQFVELGIEQAFQNACYCRQGEKMEIQLRDINLPHYSADSIQLSSINDCRAQVTEVEDSIDLVFEVEKRCGVTFDPSGRTEKVWLRETDKDNSIIGHLLSTEILLSYITDSASTKVITARIQCMCLNDKIDDPCAGHIFNYSVPAADICQSTQTQVEAKFNEKVQSEKCAIISGPPCVKKIDDAVQIYADMDQDTCVSDGSRNDKFQPIRKVNSQLQGVTYDIRIQVQHTTSARECVAVYEQRISCSNTPSWSQWSEFAQCNSVCGEGLRIRRRICQNGLPSGPGCKGPSVESVDCQNSPCEETCPAGTKSLDDEWCACETKSSNRLSVLVPSYLSSNVALDAIKSADKFVESDDDFVVANLVIEEKQIKTSGFLFNNYETIYAANFLYDNQFLMKTSFELTKENYDVLNADFAMTQSVIFLNAEGSNSPIILRRIWPSTPDSFVGDSYDLNSIKYLQSSTVKKISRNQKRSRIVNIVKFVGQDTDEYTLMNFLGEKDHFCLENKPRLPVTSIEIPQPKGCRATTCPPVNAIKQDKCPECPICEENATGGADPTTPPINDSKLYGQCSIKVNNQIFPFKYKSVICKDCQITLEECAPDLHKDKQITIFGDEGLENKTLTDIMFEHDQLEECMEHMQKCKTCMPDDVTQWSSWGKCDTKCGLGKQRRTRSRQHTCKVSTEQPMVQVRPCQGFQEVEEIPFNLFQLYKDDAKVFVQRACQNPFCLDEKRIRYIHQKGDVCLASTRNESCAECCEFDEPSESEWDKQPCVTTPAFCMTGTKTLAATSKCPGHPANKKFERACLNEYASSSCACPTDLESAKKEHECQVFSKQSACIWLASLQQFRRVAGSCKRPDTGTQCDYTEECKPEACECDGSTEFCAAKCAGRCVLLQNGAALAGDTCMKEVKQCFDKNGALIEPCAECYENICTNMAECTAEEKDECKEQMGGELYCDTRLPDCQNEQKRQCKLKSEKVCQYTVTCDCANYVCTENSITIKGVNADFFKKIQKQTDNLLSPAVYGPNLNFYIGGADKNAFKTPGCFHHYKSEEIDLYYEFGHLQNKCGVTIKDGRLEAMIWVDAAHRQDETVASATPFAKVVCHITHDISEAPPKEVTSLMRFKPLEFIKVRKYEHDLSFDISTDPEFHELLEHRELQNLVLVGEKMYARIRSNDLDDNLKIKVVKCTVKKVNNEELSLDFIENGCKIPEMEAFDFKFNNERYANGEGPEVRFEWVNFVWRGFTNKEGDETTLGREEQQYSCDVEVCSKTDDCKPDCSKPLTLNPSNPIRKPRDTPVAEALTNHTISQEDEGVDFELEVFRTEAELKRRYQEILAQHMENSDQIDRMVSQAVIVLAVAIALLFGALGFMSLHKVYGGKTHHLGGLTAQIFRHQPPSRPPPYGSSQKMNSTSAPVDYAHTGIADFVSDRDV